MKILLFCLLLAGIGFSAAVFPQFKMAFDYQQIEIIKTDILQPFIAQMPDMGLNWTLPVNISGVTGNISNLTIMNITLDWENTHLIEPYNGNGFVIEIRNLTTTIKFDAKLKYKYIDYISGTDNYLTIESLDLFLPFGFVADSTSYYTYIQPGASVVMQNFKVGLSGVFSVISSIITPLGSKIAQILSSVATSQIAKYNDTLIAQSSFGVGTTLFDTIQLNLTFANPPSQFYVAGDTYGSMQFDLLVTNVKTGQVAPLLSDDDLTNYTVGGLPMQFMIGEQMISEIVWAVFQSGKVNVTISNATAPPQVPVQLYTDDLIILFPNLPQDFGADKGCYINIQAGGQDPIAYIRDGRIVLEVAIGFNVWVDTSSAQYPQQGLDNCTTCQLAIALNMSAFVAVDVYTFNSTTIGAKVLDVYMNKVQLIQGDLDPAFFQNALNGLLVPIVEQINDSIESGVQIPFIQLIQLYGLDNLDVFIGEGFLQFGLEMVQKNNNPSFMWLAPYLQQAI